MFQVSVGIEVVQRVYRKQKVHTNIRPELPALIYSRNSIGCAFFFYCKQTLHRQTRLQLRLRFTASKVAFETDFLKTKGTHARQPEIAGIEISAKTVAFVTEILSSNGSQAKQTRTASLGLRLQ